jgi:hypothetical protein
VIEQLTPALAGDQVNVVLVLPVPEAVRSGGALGTVAQALVVLTGCHSAGTLGGSQPGSEVWDWMHL